jgi:hypothetical protein
MKENKNECDEKKLNSWSCKKTILCKVSYKVSELFGNFFKYFCQTSIWKALTYSENFQNFHKKYSNEAGNQFRHVDVKKK